MRARAVVAALALVVLGVTGCGPDTSAAGSHGAQGGASSSGVPKSAGASGSADSGTGVPSRPRLTSAQREQVLLTLDDLPAGYRNDADPSAPQGRCMQRLSEVIVGDVHHQFTQDSSGSFGAVVSSSSTTAPGKGHDRIAHAADLADQCASFSMSEDGMPMTGRFVTHQAPRVLDESQMIVFTGSASGFTLNETFLVFRYGDNVAAVGVIPGDGSVAVDEAVRYARIVANRIRAA
ncbi:MAG TPA: hypothetical protein VGN37_26200 [Actinocatenispora sp.]